MAGLTMEPLTEGLCDCACGTYHATAIQLPAFHDANALRDYVGCGDLQCMAHILLANPKRVSVDPSLYVVLWVFGLAKQDIFLQSFYPG